MLVLSRRQREEVVIQVPGREPITIGIAEIRSKNVCVMTIDAEKEIKIFRREVFDRIEADE